MEKSNFQHRYSPLPPNRKSKSITSAIMNEPIDSSTVDCNMAKKRKRTVPNLIGGTIWRNFLNTGMFNSPLKNGLSPDGSTTLSPEETQNFCNLEESPFYIFKACAQGLADVVERLLNNDAKKIFMKDTKGWTCLHHASARGKTVVIDLLLKRGADINAKDDEGNTPLHIAIEKSQKDSINHLLTNKADASILNLKSFAPIHLAVNLNKPKMIEELLKFPDLVDVELKGHLGKRAIHYAAVQDHWECADTLLKCGSKLCQPCDNGFYALHFAAKSAASKTIKVLVENGLEAGYTRENLLSWSDKENNSPLHLAVNSGDIDTVKACLEFGAKVDALQENKSTALHFACAQGTLSIVQLLFETHMKQKPSDDGKNILVVKDILNMTPLHRAAMYDHSEVVRFLIEQRSTLDEIDLEHRTPLLLSAVRGGSRSFRILLEAGADIQVKDNYKRNVLHYLVTYAVGQAGVIPEIEDICKRDEGRRLLNQKDVNGCTPLHVATREGNIKFTETLIKLGAIVNLKDNEDQSPLHFAARFGRYNTVRKLLESHAGPNIINESDGGGMTAMHIASMNGQTKVVQLLLHKGALIHKDYMGRSPLHLAAENGYTQTIKMLLSFHTNLLDQTCKKGNTALHYAAESNQASAVNQLLTYNCKYTMNDEDKTALDIAIERQLVECAMTMVQHDRLEEILSTYNYEKQGCPLLRLIQHLPEVYKQILNRSYTKSPGDRRSKNYWEKFDFKYMQVNHARRRELEIQGTPIRPLFALNTMVEFGRIELLSHPLCLKYLNMKWLAYGFWFFIINIILYMTFVVTLTKSVINLHIKYTVITTDFQNETENRNETEEIFSNISTAVIESTTMCNLLLVYVALFACLNMVKEFVQIFQQRIHYFFDYINYVEWSLYLSSLLFAAPTLFQISFPYRWECGSVAVFVAWFNLLLYLQRLDTIGLYVVMFRQILNTIFKVVFVFSVLFIAFGLAFYVLLWEDVQGGFKSPFISIIHSIMFMMGDWNYVEVFAKPYFEYPGAGKLSYPILSFAFLLLFVVLIPILFINLLIGLAVGDIEIVQRDASLKRLAMQVEYHTELEEKLPQKLIEKVDRMELVLYPNTYLKSSIFETVLAKFRCMCGGSNVSSSEHSSSGDTSATDGVLVELNKTKMKLKDVQTQMDRMHDLLKLIVQKMDISEEADTTDDPTPYKGKEDAGKIMNKTRTLRIRAKLAPLTSTKNAPKS